MQGQQQPDPNMVLAMAEQQKAEADLISAQTKQAEAQAGAQQAMAELQIKSFEAETDRAKVTLEFNKLKLQEPVFATQAMKNIADAHSKQHSTYRENISQLAGMISPQQAQ